MPTIFDQNKLFWYKPSRSGLKIETKAMSSLHLSFWNHVFVNSVCIRHENLSIGRQRWNCHQSLHSKTFSALRLGLSLSALSLSKPSFQNFSPSLATPVPKVLIIVTCTLLPSLLIFINNPCFPKILHQIRKVFLRHFSLTYYWFQHNAAFAPLFIKHEIHWIGLLLLYQV